MTAKSFSAALFGFGLCFASSEALGAQTVDALLVSGLPPADAESAPAELELGYGVNSALRVASELTLTDDHEHGFCFAKSGAKSDGKLGSDILALSQSNGGQMGISLHCEDDGGIPALAEMHTHPSFSVGIPSTADFGGIDPTQMAFLVAHPVDGEATAILITRAARDDKTLGDFKSITSASAVLRVMVLEFLQGAGPTPGESANGNFDQLYLGTVCSKLQLACYYRANWVSKFLKVRGIDDLIAANYSPIARHRGLVRVQLLLDWLGGENFHMPDNKRPLVVNSMQEAMTKLDQLRSEWQGAVIFTSPHVIINVHFPTIAHDNFVGLAIPPDSDSKIMEKGGSELRTFSATEDVYDPDAAISGCIRLGQDVTIEGSRYDDALFGDISLGSFQHHCFSLRAGPALQLTANETVADGFMTTILSGGDGAMIRTALADFCPPPSRDKIVFCTRKPSFNVP